MASVLRNIWFYRVIDPDEPDPDWRFNPRTSLLALDLLPYTYSDSSELSPGRIVAHSDDADLCAWVDKPTDLGSLRFGTVRKGALPVAVSRDRRRPLPLDPDEGLLEETHVQFFPDNIVGAVFNFHAPRASTLPGYLRETVNGIPRRLHFSRLGVPDIKARLDRMTDLTLMQLAIRYPYVHEIDSLVPGLGASMERQAQVNSPDIIEIGFRTNGRSSRKLSGNVIDAVRNLVGLGRVPEIAKSFKVKGYDPATGKNEELDILKAYMVQSEEIVLQDEQHRTLVSDSAYGAIEKAYSSRRMELLEAPAIG